MKYFKSTVFTFFLTMLIAPMSAYSVSDQQRGSVGKIERMIVNHNANADEIYITTDELNPPCNAMTLRTNDVNVSITAYKILVAHLTAARFAGKTVEFYTDSNCRLFRIEVLD